MIDINLNEVIPVIIGAGCAVAGISKQSQYKKLVASGVRTQGEVVEMIKESPNNVYFGDGSNYEYSANNSNYFPVIGYKTLTGEWLTHKSIVGSNPPAYAVGDKVDIIYDPDDNASFIINNKLARLIGPIFITVGLVIIIGVVVYFLFQR